MLQKREAEILSFNASENVAEHTITYSLFCNFQLVFRLIYNCIKKPNYIFKHCIELIPLD